MNAVSEDVEKLVENELEAANVQFTIPLEPIERFLK